MSVHSGAGECEADCEEHSQSPVSNGVVAGESLLGSINRLIGHLKLFYSYEIRCKTLLCVLWWA